MTTVMISTMVLCFALTISVATILSAFNSLTLSPALGAVLLRRHEHGHESKFPPFRWLKTAGDKFNSSFDRMSNGYARGVSRIVTRRVLMLGVYGLLVASTFFLFRTVPPGFIPPLDRGYAIVVIQLPDGASLSRTDEVTQKATKLVEGVPAAVRADERVQAAYLGSVA